MIIIKKESKSKERSGLGFMMRAHMHALLVVHALRQRSGGAVLH